MSAAESPAAVLRRAAEKLRELANRAVHEGRTTWATGHTLDSRSPVVVDDPEEPSVLIETYAARLEAVNRYIAAMGPGVGAALAEVFDQWARIGELDPDLLNRVGGRETIAVARLILGEVTE